MSRPPTTTAGEPDSLGGRMDPRIARSHAAVMDAARELLVELGPDGLTVDGVVARSGVAKSTVYRHWKTRDDLVTDVFAACMPTLDPSAADVPARDALRDLVGQFAHALSDPQWQRLFPALLVLKAQSHALSRLNEDLKGAQQELATDVLSRCVDAGVLDPVVLVDPERTGLFLVGPLLAVALVGGGALDDSFVDEVVARFVRAYAPEGR